MGGFKRTGRITTTLDCDIKVKKKNITSGE